MTPFGTPPHRATPAPLDYIFSKENRPSDEEKKQLTIDFKGLNYRSAICYGVASCLHAFLSSNALLQALNIIVICQFY